MSLHFQMPTESCLAQGGLISFLPCVPRWHRMPLEPDCLASSPSTNTHSLVILAKSLNLSVTQLLYL